MNKQKATLNSCEVLIEKAQLPELGDVYFVWRKGKKYTQSLKHHADGNSILIRQKLQLELKTYSYAGKIQTKQTHLSLLNAHETELWSCTLGIHEWDQSPTRITLSVSNKKIKTGSLTIRVVRKEIMELENFNRHSGEIEESSEEQKQHTKKAYRSTQNKDEVIKLRQELEDANYINAKLKNDRAMFELQKEKLQEENYLIKERIKEQFQRIDEHYSKKVQIRQSAFSEQIQELIETFNQNFQSNNEVIQQLIMEIEQYHLDILEQQKQHEKLDQKKDEQFAQKVEMLETEIQEYQNKNHELQTKLANCQNRLTETNDLLQIARNDIDHFTLDYEDLKNELRKKLEEADEKIQQLESNIIALNHTIAERDDKIDFSNLKINDLENRVKSQEQEIIQRQKELQALTDENLGNLNKAELLSVEIDTMKLKNADLDEFLKDKEKMIEELEKQRRDEADLNEEAFQDHMRRYEQREIQISDEMEIMRMEKVKVEESKYDVENQLQEKQNRIEEYEKQIEMYKAQLEEKETFLKRIQEDQNRMEEEKRKIQQDLLESEENRKDDQMQITELQTDNHQLKMRQQEYKAELLEKDRQIFSMHEEHQTQMKNRMVYIESERDEAHRNREASEMEWRKINNDIEFEKEYYKEEATKYKNEYLDLLSEKEKLEIFVKEVENNNQQYRNDARKYEELFRESEERYNTLLKDNYEQGLITEEEKMRRAEDSLASFKIVDSLKVSKTPMEASKFTLKYSEDPDTMGRVNQLQKEIMKMETLIEKKNHKIESLQQEIQSVQKECEDCRMREMTLKSFNEHNEAEIELLDIQIQYLKEEIFNEEQKVKELQTKLLEKGLMQKFQMTKEKNRQKDLEERKIKAKSSLKQAKSDEGKSDDQKSQNKLKEKSSLASPRKRTPAKEFASKSVQVSLQQSDLQQSLPQSHPPVLRNQSESSFKSEDERGAKSTPIKSRQRDSQKSKESNKKVEKKKSDKRVRIEEESVPVRSRSDLAAFEKDLEIYKKQIEKKDEEIEKLQKRNRELFDQLVESKQEMALKLNMQESKLSDYEKKYEGVEIDRAIVAQEENEELRKNKRILHDKVQDLRQKHQESILENKRIGYENQQQIQQIKRLKRDIEDLQARDKKPMALDFNKGLQGQLEDANKSIIQLSKNIHLLRMEKQNAEEELNIVKKRLIDFEKRAIGAEQKGNGIEIELEDEKRKARKMKRELEDRDEELVKYRDQCKRVQEQINTYSSFNSQSMYEKKKTLEEKLETEDKLSKKDHEIVKLQKEVQRYQQKLQENEEYKVSKKDQMRREIEKLEKELIQSARAVAEHQETIKKLHGRIAFTEKEKKRMVDEQNQNYTDKLKFYVDEIALIKNLLDENEYENGNLRMENDHILEENQMLQLTIQQLEEKYATVLKYKSQLEEQVHNQKGQIAQTMKECDYYQQDSTHLHNVVAELKSELQKERLLSHKKSGQLQEHEEANEKLIYEIKHLKIKLNEHESHGDITSQLRNEKATLERESNELAEQLQTMMAEYQKYRNTFTVTKEQVGELLAELKTNFEEAKDAEVRKLAATLQRQYHEKTKKLETEVLEVYNENAKLGVEVQRKNDMNSEILNKYGEIEHFPEQYKQAKDRIEYLESSIRILKEQDNENANKARRLEVSLKELQRTRDQLEHELQLAINSYESEQHRSRKIQEQLQEAQTGEELLKEEVKMLRDSKNQGSDLINNRIQTYESKILSLELESDRLREREGNMHREYLDKVSRLELKMKEKTEEMRKAADEMEKQAIRDIHLKNQELQECKRENRSLAEERKNNKQKIQALTQENDDLSLELMNARNQLAEDEELYIIEINNLKNKLGDMEEVYQLNLNNLEEELAHLNKELTLEKLKRKNQTLESSRLRESEVDRRYEDKCKQKQAKIQELKGDIVILEEAIRKLKKKESSDDQSNSEKFRNMHEELIKEYEAEKGEAQQHKEKLTDMIKGLKKENAKLKQSQQEDSLRMDHQLLEMQSLKCQLKTVHELYSTLQKEVDRRQTRVGEQMEMQNHFQKQIEFKTLKIAELQEKCNECLANYQKSSKKLFKKEQEMAALEERNAQLAQALNKVHQAHNNATNNAHQKDQHIEQIHEKVSGLQKQNKRLTNEISLLNNKLIDIREQHGQLEKQWAMVRKEKEQLKAEVMENNENNVKFLELSKKCYNSYGITIEEMLSSGFWDEKLFDKEQEINQLAEELEELKFLQERRFLDYDEIKKENFELEMRMEDYEILSEQIDTLRRICDKLEEEKKIVILREETLRLQIENVVMPSVASDAREKVQHILLQDYDPYS